MRFEPHYKYYQYVRALNKFYLEHPEMWECDTSWEGFHWISAEDNQNSVIAFRRIAKNKDELVVVCNFQPVRHEIYEIGVPYYADYEEVFSSDAVEFGGSGITNGTVTAKTKPMHDEQYRISLDIPPMSVIYLKPKNIRDPQLDENKKSELTVEEFPAVEEPKAEVKSETFHEPIKTEEVKPQVPAAPVPNTNNQNFHNGYNNSNRNSKRKGKHRR